MAKKSKRTSRTKKKKNDNLLRNIIIVLSLISSFIVLFLGGYYFGYHKGKDDMSLKIEKKEKERIKAIDRLEKVLKENQPKQIKKNSQTEVKKSKKYDITAAHEIDDKKALQPLPRKQHPKHHKKVPKLAIIFDDVSFGYQVKQIKKLHLKVTMSFFPPTAIHPKTPKLAAKEPFYMIHLPMEAMNFNKEETFTLHVNDSLAVIDKRIKTIKELFPRVRYINNHTGSKFTSNKASVEKLITVLDKYNIKFLDSRTTSKTKVKEVMEKHHHRYMARDVFLDHKGDVASIKKQIALAVKIAKKYGAAIAIGHPHSNTLKALQQSKKLLKGVELVYVYQLY